MANLPFHPKYGFFDFDSKTGFDSCHLSLSHFSYSGFLLKSPLDEYMLKKFNIRPARDPKEKPFKASWMISNRKLELGFLNGILNGKTMFTSDIYPDLSDEELLHPITFNGFVDFIVLKSSSNTIRDKQDFRFPLDHLKLTFSGGILIKKECLLTN
jgi:hypothetical protein